MNNRDIVEIGGSAGALTELPLDKRSRRSRDVGGSLAGRRILIVEDEYFIANELHIAFEVAGAEPVGLVPSVARALKLLGLTHEVDGAMLDINLRGEMAYPVAEALRSRNVPFVSATGDEASHIPAEFRSVPRYEKPIQPQQIAFVLFGPA